MCPPDSASQGPLLSCELARTRAEAPARRQVRSRRPGFGKATTPLPRFFGRPRASRIANTTRHERLQTGRAARANLTGEISSRRDPIAGPRLSGVPDTPMSELPGARTILGLPILPDGGSFPFPLPPGQIGRAHV